MEFKRRPPATDIVIDDNDLAQLVQVMKIGVDAKLIHERNSDQGAWGDEGRIHIYNDTEFLHRVLGQYYTAGIGNILYRVNCNALYTYLSKLV